MTDKEKIIAKIKQRMEINKYADTQDALWEDNKILDFISNLPTKQPSEDLEDASKKYADNEEYGDDAYFAIKMAFKAGANWQKEKELAYYKKKVIETEKNKRT